VKLRHRQRVDRLVHPNRALPARVFRVHPDPDAPFVVEVRIARDPRRMRNEMRRVDGVKVLGQDGIGPDCSGLVRSWHDKRSGVSVARPGRLVARMYLNTRDLRKRPSEIVAHECTHAGMAWARLRRANLHVMPGEEVLCYAVGRLVKQVNRICFAHGVWPQ